MSDTEPTPSATYQLHVVDGEQVGADIELEERENYSIGASNQCNIVLFGKGLVDVHLECVFLDGVLTVLECENDVRLDGQVVEKTPFSVQQGQLISFADITLAFGTSDTNWDELATKSEELHKQVVHEEKEQKKQARSKTFGLIGSIFVFILFIALAAGIGWWFFSQSSNTANDSSTTSTTSTTDTKQPPKQDIQTILTGDSAYSNVEMVGTQNNNKARPIIKGYVDSLEDLTNLRTTVSNNIDNSIRPVYYVAVKSQLLEDVKGAMRNYDFGLQFELEFKDKKLNLDIAGIANNIENPNDLRKTIKDNFPLVDDIEVNVKSGTSLLNELQTIQSQHMQYSNLQFTPSVGTLTVTGALLKNFVVEFNQELEGILKKYEPNNLKVVNSIQVGPEFDGKIVSLLINASNSYAVINLGGKEIRAQQGTKLSNGFTLKTIHKDHIELEISDAVYNFPVK